MKPVEGMTVEPAYVEYDGGYMWLGFVQFAIGEQSFRDEFREATGHDLDSLVYASPIERMIDEATGRDKMMMLAFLDWVTVEHWGVEGEVVSEISDIGGWAKR